MMRNPADAVEHHRSGQDCGAALANAGMDSRAEYDAQGALRKETSDAASVDTPQTPQTRPQRIRVLHSVGHLLRGGIETWLYQTIRHLDPEVYEHHVLVWTEDEQAFTEEFRAAGATVLACPGHTNPIRFAYNLRRLIRAHGPYDLLHTHGTHFHGLVMLLARALGVKKVLAHSHTDIQPVLASAGIAYRTYAAVGNWAIRSCADAGFAVSDRAAVSMFGPSWAEERRWKMLYCGIDFSAFDRMADPALRQRLGIPGGRHVVGHIGRFHAQKNQHFLLEVAERVIAVRPDVHFLLIGDGPDRASVTQRAERLGVASHITIVRDCRTVPLHLLSAMDSFILPSLYEGLALAAVEAQAAGLSCLISDSVTAEVVVKKDSVRRLSLSQGAEAWASALLDLPLRSENQSENLRRWFLGGPFDIVESAKLLDSAYQDLTMSSLSSARPKVRPKNLTS
jgi:glycosyltransferase involved in cell wall biosynthesis